MVPALYMSVHPIGSTGVMNFKFGYSCSRRGNFVTETSSKQGCIAGEERIGVGESGAAEGVSGILTRIRTIK